MLHFCCYKTTTLATSIYLRKHMFRENTRGQLSGLKSKVSLKKKSKSCVLTVLTVSCHFLKNIHAHCIFSWLMSAEFWNSHLQERRHSVLPDWRPEPVHQRKEGPGSQRTLHSAPDAPQWPGPNQTHHPSPVPPYPTRTANTYRGFKKGHWEKQMITIKTLN